MELTSFSIYVGPWIYIGRATDTNTRNVVGTPRAITMKFSNNTTARRSVRYGTKGLGYKDRCIGIISIWLPPTHNGQSSVQGPHCEQYVVL
jgi:hypothetical protein